VRGGCGWDFPTIPDRYDGGTAWWQVGPASSPCFVYSALEFWPLPFANLTQTLCSDLSGQLLAQYRASIPGFSGCTPLAPVRRPLRPFWRGRFD
jgi:hypothetical protein